MDKRQKLTIALAVGIAIALVLGLGLGLGLARRHPSNDKPWLNFRLPDYIVPSNYELTLMIDIAKEMCHGTNKIQFQVLRNTHYVLLHAHANMEISSASLQWRRGEALEFWEINRTFRYPKNQYYVVEVVDILPKGEEFILEMEFSYSLTDAYYGIFKYTYTDPQDGSKKSMVVSDMEPTDARRGYPCFDEPAMKARFRTTITHEKRYFALSNMPVTRTIHYILGDETDWTETVFEESPPMSTYLTCFIVCQFDYVEGIINQDVPIRIYATPTRIANGDANYALEVTQKMFVEYENFFNMTYPLPKYDQVAIPDLGGFGAMENWGLVTFGEDSLLWNRKDSSAKDQQMVAAIVAHEMVHAWIGNLVSIPWWDSIWLTEGFASFLQFKGLSWAEPDWLWEGYHVIDDVQTAMRADELSTSHPLKMSVNSTGEIRRAFDKISYKKGSSVLHMIHNTLGHKLFLGGIRYFVKDHAFSVANEKDFYKSMQRYIDEQEGFFNITEIMDPWVHQRGFPLVTVGIDDAGNSFASQRIMLADTEVTKESFSSSVNKTKWSFNLDYYTQKHPSHVIDVWFPATDVIYNKFDLTDVGDWFKFNRQECGYWRVNYDYYVWEALARQLNHDKAAIHEYDRTQLLDDVFNLAPISKVPYTTALDLTTYLDKEESFFVWSVFNELSSYIKAMLTTDKHQTNFKKYYLTRVKPISDKLGWNASEGTHEEQRNRPIVLELALQYVDQEAVHNVSFLFSEWRKGESISLDIRSLVYRYGILNGSDSDWEYMFQRYKNEIIVREKDLLLRGLAATEKTEHIARLLNDSMDPSIIKPKDFFKCIGYISNSVNGNEIAWWWLSTNWNYIVQRFSPRNYHLGKLIMTFVSNYNTLIKRWQVEQFFLADQLDAIHPTVRAGALHRIDQNIKWIQKNEESIGQWLQEKVDELL